MNRNSHMPQLPHLCEEALRKGTRQLFDLPSCSSISILSLLSCSEYQRNKCLKCKKSTLHIVFTHSVHCCDRTSRNQQTFAISQCCECNTEHSPCRECCKKAKAIGPANHAACLRKMYKWTKNPKSATKYSLKCDVCNTGYVLCNYCRVISEIYLQSAAKKYLLLKSS